MDQAPEAPTFSADEVGRVALVTGGAGYLGRHLVARLVESGAEVRTLDIAPSEPVDGVQAILGDIRDYRSIRPAFEGVDVVYHTAALIELLAIYTSAYRRRVFDVNVLGTQQVIRACRDAGVSRLVYTSSHNVVIDREILEGDESERYAETYMDIYTETKAAAERDVLAADGPELRTVALRPGGIWGSGAGVMMIDSFLEQLASGAFKALVGDGSAVVDNTHVDSLVDAQLLAARGLLQKPETVGGKPYFISDDERINGVEWFRPLAEALGEPWPTMRVPAKLMYGIAWAMEVAHFFGAPAPTVTRGGVLKLCRASSFRIDAARADLGYAPRVKSVPGLRALAEEVRPRYEAMRRDAGRA